MNHKKLNMELLKEYYGIAFNDNSYRKKFIELTNNLYKYKNHKMIIAPEDVIMEWDEFVFDLKNGYYDIPPEFDNGLDIVRNKIDPITESEFLQKFDNHKVFCSIIKEIDSRFIELTNEVEFLPNEWQWWKRRVLKKAGRDYAEFINAHWTDKYGIKVEVIEEKR